MAEKKPDDIMAEYLLKGGKMLSRTCRTCGSPLFEVKGETVCVVCRERGRESGKEATAPAAGVAASEAQTGSAEAAAAPVPGKETDEVRELRATIAVLARRAREEPDPERCLALLEAAREAAEALSLLHL